MKKTHIKHHLMHRLPLVAALLVLQISALAQSHDVTTAAELAEVTGSDTYVIKNDIDVSSDFTTIAAFSGTLEADINPTTKMPYRIKNLGVPLFTSLTGTVRNLVIESVSISQAGQVGAVACTASGSARIYNVGILGGSVGSTGTSTASDATDCCGGLVGLLDGNTNATCTPRVVNCYSYANITGGNRVGGIVGYNNYATDKDNQRSMIFACMFYGNITAGSNKAPIYNGTNISNKDNKGVSAFCYFRAEAPYVQNQQINTYNCALMAETRFLQRFEFYRHLLNGNRELAAWWVTGDVTDTALIMKWVMLPDSIGTTHCYPILKEWGRYPSVVNIDAEHATTGQPRNKGGKLGTLSVTIQMDNTSDATVPYHHPTDAAITTSSLTLNITDKDPDHFNFNYYKVQLPYYNDVGTKNYTGDRVVVGWKITSITGGTTGSFNPTVGTASNDAPNWNFADRNCTNKDLYSVSGRVFNQGDYWDVPEGVTAITIQPYWAKAAYVANDYRNVVYNGSMGTKYNVDLGGTGGGQWFTNGSTHNFTYKGTETLTLTVYNAISNAVTALSINNSHTVYDYAVVLVGNHHYVSTTKNAAIGGSKVPYTVMSIDLDCDNEPDYALLMRYDGRAVTHPVKYDFINLVGLGMAQKSTGSTGSYNFGIPKPDGWFEVTNTALFRVTQMEYCPPSRAKKPIILHGGVIEQWVSSQGAANSSGDAGDRVLYYHVGDNVWFKEFHIGVHQDFQNPTPHPPISVTGGDYNEFYLTGAYRADANHYDDNAECYINGGRFGVVAGAGREGIGNATNHTNGNITWQIDNADIGEFYGGGLNFAHVAQGNISTTISNSHVGMFCGGPKFGDMNTGKTVVTNATNCTFGTYFGAGYGGNSYNRYAPKNQSDVQNIDWNDWVSKQYKQEYNYGGVSTQIAYQFIPMSGNASNVARLFVDFVAFSLATTRDVTTNLTGCTITGNFYGGGSLGKVDGPVNSNLNNCTVNGNVYGAGYSASLPSVVVEDMAFQVTPYYYSSLGTYRTGVNGDTTFYTWAHRDVVNNTATAIDKTNHILYTTEDLTGLGKVLGNVNLTITGSSSHIYGDVYGGGAISDANTDANNTTTVNILDGTFDGNIYGGGQGDLASLGAGHSNVAAKVHGEVIVNIGKNEGGLSGNASFSDASSIFGCNNINGSPQADVTVNIYQTARETTEEASYISDGAAYAIPNVFGGGNKADYLPADVDNRTTVHIHGCLNTIENVYGGGNAAAAQGVITVVQGGRFNQIFGGGNGYSATGNHNDPSSPNYNPGADIGAGGISLTVHGGTINQLFGGSNQYGAVSGTTVVNIDNEGGCTENINEFFGGGNEAVIGTELSPIDLSTTISCSARQIGTIYGGSNKADIYGNVELTIMGGGPYNYVYGGSKGIAGTTEAKIFGDVTLNIYGGAITNAFGGADAYGNITGDIQVNVDWSQSDCADPKSIDNVYGGGNMAPYTPDPSHRTSTPEVNIKHGTVNNSVFGGGLGDTAIVTANPVVNVGDNNNNHYATVAVNVYGGGELAAVNGSTVVNVQNSNTVIRGTVYGAGKGVYNNPEAAIVTGNATVNIDGGNVQRSVYGGGELSSVGTFTSYYTSKAEHSSATVADGHVKGEPEACSDNTGLTSVYIRGGIIGLMRNKMPNPSDTTSNDDFGYVFCAGKGLADSTIVDLEGVPYANRLAVNDSTYFEMSGGLVTASVYGGSENGEVLGNTHVKIMGGQIGVGYYVDDSDEEHWDDPYTDQQWSDVLAEVRAGTFDDGDAAGFHFCDAWPFKTENERFTYDHYAKYKNPADGLYYYDSTYTQSANNGANSAGDGHSFFGHVFGGGSGYYPFAPGVWRRTAGRVKGNTLVEITGGHILTNVYGGNEITDVLGNTRVVMTGGTLGVPRSYDSIQGRPVNCNLFGAGMGDPRVMFNQWSNVDSTEVIVGGNAVIFGSVFGGGEDGHVLGSASTTIKDSAVIGTAGNSGLDGNVYGGGRGFSTWALTAGVVCGNVELTIQDSAKIHGSIYGGGRMAAVGTYLVPEGHADYGKMQPDNTHGNITISITGGTIGNSYQMGRSRNGITYSIGDVFGGSKGTLDKDVARNQRLGLVKNTTVNISQADGSTTHILGNVYGGGEIASVGHYTYATAQEASDFNDIHTNENMVEGDVNGVVTSNDDANVGLATISITGGTIGTEASIGTAEQIAAFTHRLAGNTLYNKGFVFGGCLGMAGTNYSGYSFVTNSSVTVNGGLVMASVFGGGENGHVFDSTDVKIQSGRVGQEMDSTEHYEDDNGVGVVEDVFFGNVYGGGRGIDTYRDQGVVNHSVTAGRVRQKTRVTMTGGRVTHNIYGGGSLASVGYKDENESGKATVTITGGIVGYSDGHTTFNDNGDYSYNNTAYASLSNVQKDSVKTFYMYAGNNEGNVYGSGRGHAGQGISDQYVSMAFTKNTFVAIGGDAQVRGSVFGGGENGHVRKNTKVTVADNAQIGVPLMSAVSWGDAQWKVSPDGYVSHDTLIVNNVDSLSEGYYQHENLGSGLHLHEHWVGDNGEGPTIYRGNVYGGGRGVTPTDNIDTSIDAHNYSATAGRVYGNATVEVTGGHIYHDVFGGGSLASVGTLVYSIEGSVKKDPMGNVIDDENNPYIFRMSKTNSTDGWSDTAYQIMTHPYYIGDPVTGTGLATVIVSGGIIGTSGINEGGVFGSGRGIAGTISSSVAHLANANNTIVYVRDSADIRGAVFGGGANGHVTEDTYVEMTGGTVGVSLPLAVRKIDEQTGHGYRIYNGNVYGGGRGVSVVASTAGGTTQHLSETAGRVFGNTHVKISGGLVYHSVFGGGSLASVGTYSYKDWGNGVTHDYRHLFVQGTGQAVVHITGDATIGNPAKALEKPLNQYDTNDALTAQYLLRTQIDNAEWHIDSAAAAAKWAALSDSAKHQMFTELNYHYLGSNSGMVFGSGRGVGALHNGTIDQDYVNSAFTRNTIVIVDNDGDKMPVICGSVFGGGENGHVKINTHVDIKGGIIGGIPLHNQTFHPGLASDNGIDGDSTYHFSTNEDLVLRLEFEDNEDNAGHGPAVYRGNVYGGGRGVDHTDAERPETGYSATAGRVYGDVEVNVSGGMIYHHVFGGGSLASAGTYLTYADGVPYRVDSLYEYKLDTFSISHETSTSRVHGLYAARHANFPTDGREPDTMYVLAHAKPGTVNVNVSGGQVGVTGVNEGSVFGGGRGIAGLSSDMVTLMAYCYKTNVNISDSAMVRGSVFGGGANGHVLTDASVTMTGGTVGVALDSDERTINDLGEADIKVYHGNVYGGGRGVDPINSGAGLNLSYTAGRVYGNASVNITGGTVLHNVYGGGSLATVGTILYRKNDGDSNPGTSLAPVLIDTNDLSQGYFDSYGTMVDSTGRTTVTIGGTATIGDDGMNNGSVFGSCRGMAGPHYSDRAYVSNATVNIEGNAVVHGSVFGSGENGHVLQNTHVNVRGSSTIGTALPAGYASLTDSEKKKYDYIGNVYGAGRGVDSYLDNGDVAYSYSAGYVRGSTFVTVSGTPTIYRNVYGGGSMGLVGDYGEDGSSDFWKVSNNAAAWIGDPSDADFWDKNDGSAHVTIQGPVGYTDYVAMGYGGNVYGSSRGVANDPATRTTNFAEMAYVVRTNVSIENGADVKGNVYGGGENGHVDWGGTTVNVIGGNVAGNVFGGGRGSITSPTAGIVDGNTQVNIGTSLNNGSATIGGDVFAGNDTWGSPLGTMRVDVWSTAHTDGTGGNPDNRYPSHTFADADNPTDEELNTALNATDDDDDKYAIHAIYGGGNLAHILTGTAATDYSGVIYDNNYITQRLNATPSNPSGYYPWPAMGGVTRKSVVYIHGCDNTIKYVYGGGKAANTIQDDVTIEGGRIYQVFAGGDGSAANTESNVGYTEDVVIGNTNSGNASVVVNGGIVRQVFGGSNTRGVVRGISNVQFEQEDSDCPLAIENVFGGGNHAPGGSGTVTIPCGARYKQVFGGANNADIGSLAEWNAIPRIKHNVELNIEGGIIEEAFGGNNTGGVIYGDVTVNVRGGNIGSLYGGNNLGGNIMGKITINVELDDDYDCADGLNLNTVYGGGNMALYQPDDDTITSPIVNIIHTTSCNGSKNFNLQNVYGGGFGNGTYRYGAIDYDQYTGYVHSNPTVNIGGNTSNKQAIVYGCVFGGGQAAPVDGSTMVKLNSSNGHIVTVGSSDDAPQPTPYKPTEHGDIFGGGLGATATVSGNTSVWVFGNRTTVYHNVYGGGNAGVVKGSTDVQVGTSLETITAMPDIIIDNNGMVTFTSRTPDVSFRYTTDGSKPTSEIGTAYSAPFQAEANQIINVVAYRNGYTTSAVATSVAVPIPVPTVNADRTISLNAHGPNDATIYYTKDGSTPDPQHSGGDNPTQVYSSAITATCGQTIKAIAVKTGYTTSAVSYSTVATPTISLIGSTATVSCTTTGATLRYTISETAGTEPDNPEACTTLETVSNGGTVSVAAGKTLKVIADLPGFAPSAVATTINE